MAFALAVGACHTPAPDCLLTTALGGAENIVQAAIKSVPLGHSAGQRIFATGENIPRQCGRYQPHAPPKGLKPFAVTNLKTNAGLADVIAFIETKGMLRAS